MLAEDIIPPAAEEEEQVRVPFVLLAIKMKSTNLLPVLPGTKFI